MKTRQRLTRFGILLAGMLISGITLLPVSAWARPVSYPDSWTVMLRNDADQNSAHIHYTFDMRHSLGLRLRYDREGDFTFTGAQLNRLMKRWNKPDSQANVYARFAVGHISGEGGNPSGKPGNDTTMLKADARLKDDAGIFLGLSADWETRRHFISASMEHWDNGRFGDYSSFHSRLGIAPYIANTGALHSWIMVEGHHRPEHEDTLGASLILRLFKGPSLLELGIDNNSEPLLNYIHRF